MDAIYKKFYKNFYRKTGGFIPARPLSLTVFPGDFFQIKNGEMLVLGNIFRNGVVDPANVDFGNGIKLHAAGWDFSEGVTKPYSGRITNQGEIDGQFEFSKQVLAFSAKGSYTFKGNNPEAVKILNWNALQPELIIKLTQTYYSFREVYLVTECATTSDWTLAVAGGDNAELEIATGSDNFGLGDIFGHHSSRTIQSRDIELYLREPERKPSFFKASKLVTQDEKLNTFVNELIYQRAHQQEWADSFYDYKFYADTAYGSYAPGTVQSSVLDMLQANDLNPNTALRYFKWADANMDDVEKLFISYGDNENLQAIEQEMDWLESVIDQAIRTYLMQDGHENNWLDLPMPDLSATDIPYAKMADEWGVNVYGRLAMALAMAPHIRPQALDIFFGKNQIYDRCFTEFGGVSDKNHSGFLPTGQTLCFLITAGNQGMRHEVLSLLSKESILVREQVLQLTETEGHIPWLNGILSIGDRWLHYFLTGQKLGLEHNASFPAQKIETRMDWEDVVLDDQVMEQVTEILTWLQHGAELLGEWGLYKKIKPGFRALFYGPPGTGKTLTATLIGKASQREVYKVDLSMIVSKYIGETEKNLSKVFDIAQHKDWILFFDEADALFGKRTAANSSNDRHANQQTAYLLQRIEDFPGVVILASNLRANMDEAFSRRFQSIIHFNMPSAEERYQLWQSAFSGKCTLHPEIDLHAIADEYEIAGGAIINVLRYCALSAIRRNDTVVNKNELLTGLRREFKKENRTLMIAN